MKAQICPGARVRILDKKQESGLDHFDISDGLLPVGVKRIKITCPKCKRRVWSSVATCDDGCCLYHVLVPHKVRYWWRKSANV